ncbi:MAG: GGDEF domain-containing protein, partial [Ilumatobacteraceae bacterium]
MPPPASTPHVRLHASTATGIGDTIRSSTAPASIALVGFVGIIALHVGQVIGDVAYTIVISAAIGGAVLGLYWHRPSPAWPWWNLILAGALWALASLTVDMMGTQGELTSDRSLIPDALSLPGYLLFGAALFGLLRQRDTTRRRDAVLDAVMLASLVSLVVNEVLISPTLQMQDTWVFARLSVAIYPVLSLCIFTIALRLVFAPGGNPSTSYTLLLLGTASLLIGDVVFALGEIGAVDVQLELLDVPYLLVPACMGAAALHPSSVAVGRPASSDGATLGRSRVLGVAIAMLGPVALLWFRRDGGASTFAIGICAAMAVAAVVRIIMAMRDQAVSAASMYHQATHDELTGLPGRQLLVERTDRMLDDYQRSG